MPSIMANWMLDAIERWAEGYWLVRETGIVDVEGRLDGLLVPTSGEAHCMKHQGGWFWDRIRLVGVECKCSRPDFLRGLREGQFQRYAASLSGLYIATSVGVCSPSEIPPGTGHLEYRNTTGGPRCVCRRHPVYQDRCWTADVPWRLLFDLRQKQIHDLRAEHARYDKALEAITNAAKGMVFRPLGKIINHVNEQMRKPPAEPADLQMKETQP
ncbi:MAG: hypothetical protein ABFD92_16725 [Planctomycetaceae bacterium]|nr:hypothetical protein [Planctomycetaceae bacterium]